MSAAAGPLRRIPSRGGGRDMAVAVLSGVLVTMSVSLVSALAVQMRGSLHFGASALGLGVALFFLGAAAASVPLSMVSERIGALRVMRASALLTAIMLACEAVASSWAMLLALLALAGVLSGGMQPAINLFLARRMPPGRQGLAFGLKQAAIPLAVLLGGLAVPGIALTVGWRWAFWAAAAVAVATAVLIPRSPTTLAARRRQHAGVTTPVPLVPLLVLSVGFGLGVASASGVWSFLVTSGVAAGLGKGTAGLVAAFAGGTAVAVRVAVGVAADRRGRGHFQVVAGMMVAGAAGYAVLAAGSASRVTWIFVLGAVVALGAGWGFNGLFQFAVVDAHREAPARATGLTAVGGRLGGVIGPLIVGLVGAHASYSRAWELDALMTLVGAGVVAYGTRLLIRYRRAA